MRSRRNLLVTAVGSVAVGVVLVLTSLHGVHDYYGTDQLNGGYSSTLSIAFDDPKWRTPALVGYALIWLGSLLAAGVAGHWIAAKPSRSLE
jgi:hypothetical protein